MVGTPEAGDELQGVEAADWGAFKPQSSLSDDTPHPSTPKAQKVTAAVMMTSPRVGAGGQAEAGSLGPHSGGYCVAAGGPDLTPWERPSFLLVWEACCGFCRPSPTASMGGGGSASSWSHVCSQCPSGTSQPETREALGEMEGVPGWASASASLRCSVPLSGPRSLLPAMGRTKPCCPSPGPRGIQGACSAAPAHGDTSHGGGGGEQVPGRAKG